MAGFESNGNNTDHEFKPSGGIYVLVVVVVLTAVASTLGNILVQAAFWRTASLKASSTGTLVMTLALIDLGMAVFVMPFVITTALHGEWEQSDELCIASGFVNTLLTAIQFGLLFTISINRFIAVSFPRWYQLKSKTKTTSTMVIVVVLHSLIWSIMPFLGWGGYNYIQGTLFCNINWSEHKAHSATLFTFCYLIPAVIAALLYINVYVKIRKMSQSATAQFRMSSQLDLSSGRIAADESSFHSHHYHSKNNVSDASSPPQTKGKLNYIGTVIMAILHPVTTTVRRIQFYN